MACSRRPAPRIVSPGAARTRPATGGLPGTPRSARAIPSGHSSTFSFVLHERFEFAPQALSGAAQASLDSAFRQAECLRDLRHAPILEVEGLEEEGLGGRQPRERMADDGCHLRRFSRTAIVER